MTDTPHETKPFNWSAIGDMGPLAALLNDDSVSDILINGPKEIFVERGGKLEKTTAEFPDEATLHGVAERIVAAVGRTLEANRPLVDARLADGSRVNVIAPPLAVDGTSISIRKFARDKITIDDMVRRESVSQPLGEFLKIVGHCKMNIVFSGGTGSGKTTLLNAISRTIEHSERIVTIEDAVELQLQQPHVVRLETKIAMLGQSHDEEVSVRDLLRNALRMRPDRIIVGEVRGAEAFDMMQAMNTGHEGSLTTIHANHPRDALARLENMISMANLNIPIRSIRAQISSALHLIIQTSRMRDGVRRVTFVSEIAGMEGDTVTMNDLFTYVTDSEGEDGKLKGHFQWSGIMPRCVKRVAYYGEMERLTKALGIKMPKYRGIQMLDLSFSNPVTATDAILNSAIVNSTPHDASILGVLKTNSSLTDEVITTLKSHGYAMLQNMRDGNGVLQGVNSAVFMCGTCSNGSPAMLSVSHADEIRPECPLFFPAIEEYVVGDPVNGVRLKILPLFETIRNASSADIRWGQVNKQVTDMVKEIGFDYTHLDSDNIGRYTFTNAAGTEVTIPGILDWGCAWGELTPEQIEFCKTAPQLAPWREMQESIRGLTITPLAQQAIAQDDLMDNRRGKLPPATRTGATASERNKRVVLFDDSDCPG